MLKSRFATVVPAVLNLFVPVAASADDVLPYLGVTLVFILRFLMGFFGVSLKLIFLNFVLNSKENKKNWLILFLLQNNT